MSAERRLQETIADIAMTQHRYNHAFDIAFEVESDQEDGEDVTAEMLFAALEKRLQALRENPAEMVEACGAPFDTYENEGFESCDDCGCTLSENGIGCPDGAYICQACFDAGGH